MAKPQVEAPIVAPPARERLTWNEIRARYPEEWVVMIDVEYENGDEELSCERARRGRTSAVVGAERERSQPVSLGSRSMPSKEVGNAIAAEIEKLTAAP